MPWKWEEMERGRVVHKTRTLGTGSAVKPIHKPALPLRGHTGALHCPWLGENVLRCVCLFHLVLFGDPATLNIIVKILFTTDIFLVFLRISTIKMISLGSRPESFIMLIGVQYNSNPLSVIIKILNWFRSSGGQEWVMNITLVGLEVNKRNACLSSVIWTAVPGSRLYSHTTFIIIYFIFFRINELLPKLKHIHVRRKI